MVSQIRGTVTGQALVLEQDLIVTGTKSYLEASFTFSPEWDGMSIWAKFTLGNQCWNINLHDGKVLREDRLNLTTGTWELGLLGLDPNGLPQITTEPRDLRVRRTNVDPLEPLPDIPAVPAEQIDRKAQKALDIASEVQRRADEGEFDFRIEKVYPSVEAMEADFGNPELKEGANVLIETGDPEDVDNSKWFVKGPEKWEYIGDLSGEMGIRGPQGFTFTAHTRRVENGVEISWTNDGDLQNPDPQIVYDYIHSEEFTRLAEQVRSDARESAASKNAASEFAEDAGREAGKASQALSDLLAMMGTDIATLVDGKIPASQIPSIATTEIYTVASQEAQDAVKAQNGDILIRTDQNKSYIWKDTGWVYLASPTDFAAKAGYADRAGTAEDANKINGHRLVQITQAEWEGAVKDPNTYYLIYDPEAEK